MHTSSYSLSRMVVNGKTTNTKSLINLWPLNVLAQWRFVFCQSSSSFWFTWHDVKGKPNKKVTWPVIAAFLVVVHPPLLLPFVSISRLNWRNYHCFLHKSKYSHNIMSIIFNKLLSKVKKKKKKYFENQNGLLALGWNFNWRSKVQY